ncbi:MAG: hypothetical protein DDG60_11210 [Anaerolineae bacterium]|nr:MAG: hypothetical protein DDG60_11210 [Anaerolineae bacterium]
MRQRHTGWLIFFITLLIGGLGMAATGAALYVRLVYLSALLLLSAWLWAKISLWRVGILRKARSLRASVGDIFEETFEISNASGLPRLFLEVENRSSLPQAAGSRVVTMLSAGETRTYLARTWLTRRGAFPLGPTVLRSGDPFGFFTVSRTFPAEDSLLVLPLILPISAFPSPPGLLPGGKAIQRKAYEVTPHAAGVREYTTGDPLKRIHWPSTARRGQLMVKEFEQDPQAELWLFLDAQSGIHAEKSDEPAPIWNDWMFVRRPKIKLPASTLEYSVCLAASLAHYFIQQRRAVGLVTNGPVYTVIPAERSERQESKILETLAFVHAAGELSLASLVDLQAPRMPLGSSAVLITPSGRDDVLLAVELLQRRGLRPLILLLMAESFGGKASTEALATKLEKRSLPLCKIYKGTDLTDTLQRFANLHKGLENRPWQIISSSLST